MDKVLNNILKELETQGVSQKRIRCIAPTIENANSIIDIFDRSHTLKYAMDSDFEYRYRLAPHRTIKEAEEEISQLLHEKEELAKDRWINRWGIIATLIITLFTLLYTFAKDFGLL